MNFVFIKVILFQVILLGLEHSLGHFHLVGVKLGYNPMKAKGDFTQGYRGMIP